MPIKCLKYLLGLSLLLYIVGCSKGRDHSIDGFRSTQVPPQRLAEIQKSIGTDKSVEVILSQNDPQYIRLSRSLLGQDFVWGTWIEKSDGSIYPSPFNTGMSLESIVVSFQLSPDGKWVHLFESKLQAGDSPEVNELIDRFPVVSASPEDIAFDFAQGLQSHVLKSWLDTSSLKLESAYSFTYSIDNSEGKITFAQLLKLKDASLSTMVLRHSFRPLDEDQDFSIVRLSKAWFAGFLPVRAVEAGSIDYDADLPLRRFDISGPIKWYISSNVPSRFQRSIRDGLLSWNRAFGREVIQVEQLSSSVDWASSRLNVFQWIDNATSCGGSAAFGASEANPRTGKIFSGKVLFCGGKFYELYDKAVNKNLYSREDFERELMRWAASHELGHALGFSHNFYAKYYRDDKDPTIISSSVMDYPHPEDVMRIPSVGPRDEAMVRFLYLSGGSKNLLREVNSYPLCSDDDVETDPQCTQWVRGMPIHELVDSYLQALGQGKANSNDSRILSVAIKQVLTKEDAPMVHKLSLLLAAHVQPQSKVGGLLVRYLKANKATLKAHSEEYRQFVYRLLIEFLFDPQSLVASDMIAQMLDAMATTKDSVCFSEVLVLKEKVDSQLKIVEDPAIQSQLYFLRADVERVLNGFWIH